jgi:hypothetical protein
MPVQKNSGDHLSLEMSASNSPKELMAMFKLIAHKAVREDAVRNLLDCGFTVRYQQYASWDPERPRAYILLTARPLGAKFTLEALARAAIAVGQAFPATSEIISAIDRLDGPDDVQMFTCHITLEPGMGTGAAK